MNAPTRDIECHPIVSRAQWLALRGNDVTASVASCLLGAHEYMTALELWALKSGTVDDDPEETPAMERGTLLEPVAVELMRRRNPDWIIKYPVAEYYRDPIARLGCTPDSFVTDPSRQGFGSVQIKSVEASIFRAKWRDPATGELAPPLWIAVQAIIEASLTGASWAAVAPLVVGFGLDMPMIEVPIHAGVIQRIRNEVAAFWASVEDSMPPEPDRARDGKLLERMFDPEADNEIDLRSDNSLIELLDERERLSSNKKEAETRLSEIKTDLLVRLRGHARGRAADGRLIVAKKINRKAYQVEASSYVDLRIKNGAPL